VYYVVFALCIWMFISPPGPDDGAGRCISPGTVFVPILFLCIYTLVLLTLIIFKKDQRMDFLKIFGLVYLPVVLIAIVLSMTSK